MMDPRTRRNLFILILALLILFLIFILWWLFGRKPAPAPVVEQPVVEQKLPQSVQDTIAAAELKAEQDNRTHTASLQSASKTFAERYGSYSTEAEFANLRDLEPMMTASFAAATEQYIATTTPSAEYYGVTTRSITVTVDAQDETAGTATVTITTQREEAKGSQQNVSVRYQDLVLTFEKEGDEWKVSSAKWE